MNLDIFHSASLNKCLTPGPLARYLKNIRLKKRRSFISYSCSIWVKAKGHITRASYLLQCTGQTNLKHSSVVKNWQKFSPNQKCRRKWKHSLNGGNLLFFFIMLGFFNFLMAMILRSLEEFLRERANRWKYSRMDMVKFVEDSLYKICWPD